MFDLPKFNIRKSGRELPYYKQIVRLKNGKYILVENPRFSGLKYQLPNRYCDQQFWDTCNIIGPNTGSDYQKRIAIIQIGRRIQKYPILKWQIVNQWPFIARRFTPEQLQILEKAAGSAFDISKPISEINRPPSISVPEYQVNHELQNGRMRLVNMKEHDGISKNPHAGGMRLNNPEGFSQKNFKANGFENYQLQKIKTPLFTIYRKLYNSYNYTIASLAKFWKLILFLSIILIILFIICFAKFCTPFIGKPNISNDTETITFPNTNPKSQHYIIRSVAFFKFDSAQVQTMNVDMENYITLCQSDSTLKMIIYGYTCDTGPEEYNQTLSELRATNLKDLLIKRYPFLQNRIEIIGWGENAPDSLKCTNRVQNRRVDIEIKN